MLTQYSQIASIIPANSDKGNTLYRKDDVYMENVLTEKIKYKYKVELDTMSDVREFVAAATKCGTKVTLRAGNFTANAQSLLGVALARKIDWNDLIIESDRDYYGEFRKFIVE